MPKRTDSRPLKWAAAGAIAWLGWQTLQRTREQNLAGQVVVLAGASRGLGLLLAHEFAAEGCRVAICARDPEEVRRARAELEQAGAEMFAEPCDIADREAAEQFIARVTAHYGRIDVLVNVAAIMIVGPVNAITREEMERAMAINFWGPVNTTFAVLPQMRARGYGRLVNISSIGGKLAIPHLLPYTVSKFALTGLSEGLRTELAQEGIHVTTIVPGLMRTGSQVNAFYTGDAEAEWSWFTLSGATPLTSMDARRAARRIVAATKRGEAEVILSWQAQLLTRAHGLAPELSTTVAGLVNRALPNADDRQTAEVRGMRLATPVVPSAATARITQAAEQLNEYVGEPGPSPRHAQQAGLPEP